MIDKQEVLEVAQNLNLPATTVEKDYVLGWLLAGISHCKALSEKWAFKGGTCLRKCFFKDYRFSEDLDFTVCDKVLPTQEMLISYFGTVTKWIYDKTGIEMPDFRFEHFHNPRGSVSCEGRVYYRGPLRRKVNLPKVKIDFSLSDNLALPTEKRVILHQYSDIDFLRTEIQCYSLDEIFAEKVRALIERSRARDLYDVIEVYRQKEVPLQGKRVRDAVARKLTTQGLQLPSIETIRIDPIKALVAHEWEQALGHQLAELSPLTGYWEGLEEIIRWMER